MKKIALIVALAFVITIFVGCNANGKTATAEPTKTSPFTSQTLVTPTDAATAMPTKTSTINPTKTAVVSPTPLPTATPEPVAGVKIDSGKDWIYDAIYSNNLLALPHFNFRSVEADALNAQMQAYFDEWKSFIGGMNTAGGPVGVMKCSYQYTKTGDFISVLMVHTKQFTDIPYPTYRSYTFDLRTCRLQTAEQIFTAVGLAPAEADTMIRTAIGTEIDKNVSSYKFASPSVKQSDLDLSIQEYEKQKAEGTLKLYIDSAGSLKLAIMVYRSPIHWGYYFPVLDVK